MKIVIHSISKLFANKQDRIVFIILTFLVFGLYGLAILQTSSLESFFRANTAFFIVLQFIISLFNSALSGLSLMLFWKVFKKRQNGNKTAIIQTLVAMFFSVATTGCYVCGSVLLPFVGVATSFASLPFAGLEIKVLTLFMLLYTVREFAKIYLGICKIKNYKIYTLQSGKNTINFSFKFIDDVKPFAISAFFIAAIFLLPAIIPQNISAGINFRPEEGQLLCTDH